MTEIEADHWSTQTIGLLAPYLASAKCRFRVATGFFSVAGYDLLSARLAPLKVDILVGYHRRLPPPYPAPSG